MVRDNVGTLFEQVDEKPPVLTAAQIGGLALPTLLIGGALSPQPYPGLKRPDAAHAGNSCLTARPRACA